MTVSRRAVFALSAGVMACLVGTAALATETTVHVSLWDKGGDSIMLDEMHQFGMSKGMMSDMSMALVGMTIDKSEVPAGTVTFNVTNDSKDMIHEMVLSPIASRDADLPYISDEYKIDEDAAGHLGEVAELDPGKGGALTVDLKPGLYLLYCNIPGHYIGGMWTILTVK